MRGWKDRHWSPLIGFPPVDERHALEPHAGPRDVAPSEFGTSAPQGRISRAKALPTHPNRFATNRLGLWTTSGHWEAAGVAVHVLSLPNQKMGWAMKDRPWQYWAAIVCILIDLGLACYSCSMGWEGKELKWLQPLMHIFAVLIVIFGIPSLEDFIKQGALHKNIATTAVKCSSEIRSASLSQILTACDRRSAMQPARWDKRCFVVPIHN